ncbi:PH domain-like protein [Backusella circina FSU 941]|nr:PH domain-like protein [Backusella circina FSU 941]
MSSPTNKTSTPIKPVSILKNPSSGPSHTSKTARIALSEDEDDDLGNLQKYVSDGDDDEQGTEPMSAEALELLSSEKVLKAGYLLKKGEKRRTWKKRWFVLRSSKLAMYKDKKEYKLLRIIDLHEIHKVVQVTSKNKYKYVFAFVTPKRVYYVQANDQQDMDDWFQVLNQAKEEQRLCDNANDDDDDGDDDRSSLNRDQEFAKDIITSYKSNHAANQQRRRSSANEQSIKAAATTSKNTTVPPLDIPVMKQINTNTVIISPNHSNSSGTPLGEYALGHTYPLSPVSDHTSQMCAVDGLASSEDDEEYSVNKANVQLEESRNRVLIEGYLLKLGRNKGWRKRWFVLRTDSLAYYEDDKEYSPHRIIPLVHIMDSLEIDPVSKSKQFCFKIIIPKRSYVLCAPTENDMDSWLNALVVAIRRAKKEEKGDDLNNNNNTSNSNSNNNANKIVSTTTPTTPQPHYHPQQQHHTPGRQLSSILENTSSSHDYPLQKSQSISSSESFENVSHISGVSGAGGVGGAGGALGGAPTSTTNILQLHSRASERLGRAK